MAEKHEKEPDARIRIDRLLRDTGWDIEDKTQVATEEVTSEGEADYLLHDSRGRPLAVIEAKRYSRDPYSAKQQALKYAEELKTPFIFLSNGEDIYFWDWQKEDARKVDGFFSRYDLEKRLTLVKHRKPLSTIPLQKTFYHKGKEITLWPCQITCIQKVEEAIESGKRKILIEMATGSGKTLLAGVIMKRLFQAGIIERALFLVDRIQLAEQAKETFDDYLSDYPSVVLYGGRRSKEGQVVVGTLPTIRAQLNQFTSGYFDLVITDEVHRSIFGEYKPLLTHFDAIHTGLTATPNLGKYEYVNEVEKRLIRNTYEFYGCWDHKKEEGHPTFAYGILDGIRDGHLADYDIYLARTRITLEGVRWQGMDYKPEDLERKVTAEDRNQAMVEEFRKTEEKLGGDHPRKTIVFAVSIKHATQLARFLNDAYPEFKGRYAEEIHTGIDDPQRAITRFTKESLPAIAVSVGMMETGFDFPAVENLVMMRPTRSAILYQQMRGRGSRLAPKIGKTRFLIYDFVGNSIYFNDPKTPVDKPEKITPQGTRLVKELPVEEKAEHPKDVPKEFVVIPEGSVEDIFVEKEWIEVGPEGERIDRRKYREVFKDEIQKLARTHPVIKKIKAGKEDELTEQELKTIEGVLNRPEFYFNEVNLREAYGESIATLVDFIKVALGQYKFPSREDRINEAFEAWITNQNFGPEETRVLRIVKNRAITKKEVDISDFNRPPLTQLGGLPYARKIFGDKVLTEVLSDLKAGVFR